MTDPSDRTLSPSEQVADSPLFRMVHAGDPVTSQQAAIRAQDQIAASDRAAILNALAYYAIHGATAYQIAAWCGWEDDNVRVSRRLNELRLAGAVWTFDNARDANGNLKPGRDAVVIQREGCAVHVLVEHRVACRVVNEGKAA